MMGDQISLFLQSKSYETKQEKDRYLYRLVKFGSYGDTGLRRQQKVRLRARPERELQHTPQI